MNLFFSENIENDAAILSEEEYVHCCKVLRKKIGDTIHITDGKGSQSIATIDKILKKEAHLQVLETVNHPAPTYKSIIAIAPPKNRSRWEWFVEKSVEIGIDHIIPLRTKNSERIKVNIERSKKIMRSAALQSLRYHHPIINDLCSLDDLYSTHMTDNTDCYLAHYDIAHPHLRDLTDNKNDRIVMIGPEGDFSDSEITEARTRKIQFVNLSANRLRTETAGIAATNFII